MAGLCQLQALRLSSNASVRTRPQRPSLHAHLCVSRPKPSGRRLLVVRLSANVPSQASVSAPSLVERKGGGSKQPSGGGNGNVPKQLWRGLMKRLSNLPLALGEMFGLAALSAVGTVIEQNKASSRRIILSFRCR